jgi:hypothetical protein
MDREPQFIEQVVLQQRLPERILMALLLSLATSTTTSRLMMVELFQSALSNVDEKTYLRMLLTLSA